jgi:hypothetical protein
LPRRRRWPPHLSEPLRRADFDFTNGVEVKNANILRDFAVCADAAIFGTSSVVIRDIEKCELIIALAKHRGVMVNTQSSDLSISEGIASELLFNRCDIDANDWAAIGQYAALTYVPETDQSRLDGAGAGLSDND